MISNTLRINTALDVLVWIRVLDSEERTGTQDIISRNELAPTKRRDEQKRKKTK